MVDGINVCLACDDNYAKYAGVVIASVLANAAVEDELHFFILDGGITDENREKLLSLKNLHDCSIEFVKVDETIFADYRKIKTHAYITLPTYYRLKITSLLPHIGRMIYLDCDVVVNHSLAELFNTEMGDLPLAGVHDINFRRVRRNPTYVNAGMLLMDLDNIRRQNVEEDFLAYAVNNAGAISCGDQEIINEVCRGRIKILDERWNVQSSNFVNRSSYTSSPRIVHFVARQKPWHWASFSVHKDLFFKYLQMTPWKLDEADLCRWTVENKRASRWAYLKYRPFFWLRPRFYKALYYTYLAKLFPKIFSVKKYNGTHTILHFCGFKIKYLNSDIAKKKKENPYYYYKKNNVDITSLPPATGQLRDTQLANLALLLELDHVCKQSGLTYWLDFGTLLGAIRHRGFIPWDDDIDTAMLREDYEKVIDAFKKYSRDPDIYADYFKDKSSARNSMIKVQHRKCPLLFIDIFPWDNYGKTLSINEQLQRSAEIKVLRRDTLSTLAADETAENVRQKLNRLMQETILCQDGIAAGSDCVWGVDFKHNWKNWFTAYTTMYPLKTISFEGRNFPCVNKPEVYLSRVYGDYMAYPPKLGFGHNMFCELSDSDREVINSLSGSVKSIPQSENGTVS